MNAWVRVVSIQKDRELTPAQLEAFAPANIAESLRIVLEANNCLGIEIVPWSNV